MRRIRNRQIVNLRPVNKDQDRAERLQSFSVIPDYDATEIPQKKSDRDFTLKEAVATESVN